MACRTVLKAYQQAVVLSWSQVGMAEVTGSLEHSHNALHVTGETETVMSHNQELYNYRTKERGLVSSLFLLVQHNILKQLY